MSYQVAKLIARVAENLPEMSEEVMQGWIENPKGMQSFLRGLCPPGVPEQAKLLRRVASARVSTVKKFVAKDNLKPCNIGWTGENFKANFANMVEENVADANLAVHCLQKASLDAPILAELGDKAETKLAYLFELIKKQSKGEQGILLVNGYANIVYVRDAKGALWAVYASWSSYYGGRVGACSVEALYGWYAGDRVLSRDS